VGLVQFAGVCSVLCLILGAGFFRRFFPSAPSGPFPFSLMARVSSSVVLGPSQGYAFVVFLFFAGILSRSALVALVLFAGIISLLSPGVLSLSVSCSVSVCVFVVRLYVTVSIS
jgi:hypothetical protein